MMFFNSGIHWLIINGSLTVTFYLIIIWVQSIIQTDISVNVNTVSKATKITKENLASSVWCRGETRASRLCHFNNLCYNPSIDEYIFFRGPESILFGLPQRATNGSPPYYIADLSSVDELNTHYFTFTEVPSSVHNHLNVNIFIEPTLVMKRFKPDNLMHTVHDDLLPAFATLQELCGGAEKECISKFRLAFLDKLEDYHFIELYRLLFSNHLMFSKDLQGDNIYCFQTAFVGINKETTWYNYGYRQPQGPLIRAPFGNTILNFVKFTLGTLEIQHELCNSSLNSYVVLLSRKATRRILNEDDVVKAIVEETHLKVIILDNIEENVNHAIQVIACASMVIGMHGAALVLSMFMRPTSALLELFPYAVSSEDYTPYKTLAHISGVDLKYGVWENKNVKDTVMHPEWPAELGGLTHLSPAERKHIMDSATVPKHLCCSNPYWLFRIYQDTIVNVNSFRLVLKQLYDSNKSEQIVKPKNELKSDYYPGPVLKLRCITEQSGREHSFLLTWEMPWNVQFLEVDDIKYELLMQSIADDVLTSSVVHQTSYIIPLVDLTTTYNIWVMCSMNGKVGNMQWTTCP